MKGHYDTVLVALYERRSRLIQLDIDQRVNEPSLPTLRGRINDVTDAIAIIKSRQKADQLKGHKHGNV